MKLRTYLIKTKNINILETFSERVIRFALECKRSESQVWRWLSGESRPSGNKINDIAIITDGMVKPKDWF